MGRSALAHTVEFSGTGRCIEVEDGATLLAAAYDAGAPISATCGGQGTCGRCLVRVLSGDVEQRTAGAHAISPTGDSKLACLTTVHSDAIVELVGRGKGDEQAVVGATRIGTVADLDPAIELDPPVTRCAVELVPPSLEDPVADLTRLTRAIRERCANEDVTFAPSVVVGLAETLRDNDWKVAVTVLSDGGRQVVVGCQATETADRAVGLAVDVGTTTAVVQAIDVATGNVLAETSDYNAQHSFGEDVVSRIVFSMKGEGLARLKQAVIGTVDRLIAEALEKARVKADDVTHAVFAGNTTMIHLLYGLSPKYIREDPYVPTVSEMPWMRAGDIGIESVPDAWVWAVPAVASWVGGDISAGILASGTAERDELELYIDIGTNGELVLGNKDWLLTCSCSAGPAFEGGGITHGMRAAPGAIEAVFIEDPSKAPEVTTIGGAPAQGICGSGLMDLVAELFLAGIVEPNGKFDAERGGNRVRVDEKGVRQYVVVGSHDTATGEAIVLTEPDLDNLIRAKAAIYAAMTLLADSVGLGLPAIERFTIAGGFGNKIKIRKAIDIGLAPDLPPERFEFFGNGALKGALLCAASRAKIETVRELVGRLSYVELSVNPEFMDRYVAAMFLPHTEASLFPSVVEARAEREGAR